MTDSTPSVTHAHPSLSAARDPTAGPLAARPSEIRRNSLDGAPLAGTKVLVVDDDYRNLFAMKALLERTKAAVNIAESGPDAIVALERTRDIDIVLMDIMMPVMDGYEVIRKIRTDVQFKSLPIIAVTGKVVAGERERCLDAGANDYVPKPVNTAELVNAIRPWLSDGRQLSP
jgi:CheY-like chemotaxis protein